MVSFLKRATLVLALGLGQIAAQETLLPTPLEFWKNQILPAVDTNAPGVLKGNGVKLTPDQSSLIVTSVGGTVTSFNADDGEFEWQYNPPPAETGIVRSHSQVVFTTMNAVTDPYMVYTVVENENSADPKTRAVALDMEGSELWVSEVLEGVPEGSPVVSDDGNYIFLTHNANFKTTGHFSALSADADGAIFYSQSNETTPFSPLGIYHSPIEGFYDDATGEAQRNTNDMILFAQKPSPDEDPIGLGHTFGFQFPLGFDGNASGVELITLGPSRTFKSDTAPVLTNQGVSGYFSTTRSSFYGWVGTSGLGRNRFNRGPNGRAGFERGQFAGQSVFASVALSSSTDQPFVFCGSASTEFVKMDFELTQLTAVTVATTSLIKAEAKVDPFDRVVYYVEEDGLLHQAEFDNIADLWTQPLAVPVLGEMALSKNGDILYVADSGGLISAFQVTDIPVTVAPTSSPSLAPSSVPTAPTSAPTNSTDAPTTADVDPTEPPTRAPSSVPTPGVTPSPEAAGEPVTNAPMPSGSSTVSHFILLAAMAMVSVVSLF